MKTLSASRFLIISGLLKSEKVQSLDIEIPEEVQEIYRIWRPAPLVRAVGLEKALDTPAKIFFIQNP